MGTVGTGRLYDHTSVALLRAAVWGVDQASRWWPDPNDTQASRAWLDQLWSQSGVAGAITQASPVFAARVEAICNGAPVRPMQVRAATVALTGYLLRAFGRPTPFGLFAGVAPVQLGSTAHVRWGHRHRRVTRVDTEWLAAVTDRLEAVPELLARLDVVFSNLATARGARLEAPCGAGRVHIRYTPAVAAVREAAAAPVRFDALVDLLIDRFVAPRPPVVGMLVELVRHGFLITGLRPALTVTDPLPFLLDRLDQAGAQDLPPVRPLLEDLRAVLAGVRQLNAQALAGREHEVTDARVRQRMRRISAAGRNPLAVDLALDCEVRLPEHVAAEVAQAAGALLRLTRHPDGWPAWRDYQRLFCDRYGTATVVPLGDVVDPDTGLGYPAGYPGSVLPTPPDVATRRDERLLALAWRAVKQGSEEIVLTDRMIDWLVGPDPLDATRIPPHVELAAQIRAATTEALDQGPYTVVVAPARAGGTLTSRFTATTTGAGLEPVYAALPTTTRPALAVQLSFPPAYPHAQNVTRVPAYLPHLLRLAEHHTGGDENTIALADLAVTATRRALYLVSMSRRTVIEPQVFHALAMDKQAPSLARFLAHLPRAFTPTWTVLDWGPRSDCLPYLPRVRYRRSILTPAQWRLTGDDLPGANTDEEVWRQALHSWRAALSCPDTVELRDDDRSLPVNLTQPTHAAILRAQLRRHGHATLVEAAPVAAHGWLNGRAHEVVLPLTRAAPAAAGPPVTDLPRRRNTTHEHAPGDPEARWLSLHLPAHPDRHDEIIADHFPHLIEALGGQASCWFVRYRSTQHTDHLRLRVPLPSPANHDATMAAVGRWAAGLRREGVTGAAVFDTYHPEVGRYGTGPALHAAERVFAADSWAVSTQLRHPPAAAPNALTVASMVHIVCGLLTADTGMRWLAAHPVPATPTPTDRSVADEAIRLAQPNATHLMPGWHAIADAWQNRSAALAHYRHELPADADIDSVLESLLHLHHNRALSIDPAREATCRRLAHRAARAWHARQTSPTP